MLAQAGKADSTIGRHLAAIGWQHRQQGRVPPTARDERMVIADTLSGIRREARARPSNRLAYEVRKAFEQQREVFESPPHYDEIGRRYGVKLFWPVLLVHVRMLRVAMGFCPTDERDQGLVFLLEHATLSGLADDIGQAEVVDSWRRLSCNPANVLERVESRTGLFLRWSKAERRAGLGQLLASLDPMFEYWYERDPSAWRRGISPESFDQISQLGEFPESRW